MHRVSGTINEHLSAPKSQRFLRFAIAMPIADPRNRSDFRDKREGEVFDPAASSRPPPGQRSHSGSSVKDAVSKFVLFLFVWCSIGCVPPCVRWVCKLDGLWDRLRAGSTSFWGSCFLSGILLALAPPGAVPVVGGSSDPSVPRSPGVSSQKAQGGPWAPPPCCDNSLRLCLLGDWYSVRCFRDFGTVFFCVVFLVLGVDMLFGLVPFKTCPLFALMFVSPLSFFCCLVCSPTTFISLSFSFSLSLSLRCLGNPNPVWGLGFP